MLIEIEGPSGAGKTTLIGAMAAACKRNLVIDIAARERMAGGVAWQLGEIMRRLDAPLGHPEAIFVYAARAAARVRLAVEAGENRNLVLCDRLRLSLHVQARLAGLSHEHAAQLVRVATRAAGRIHTIMLDVNHDGHCRRLSDQGDTPLPKYTFNKLRTYFRDAYACQTEDKLYIDTSPLRSSDVHGRVLTHLTELLNSTAPPDLDGGDHRVGSGYADSASEDTTAGAATMKLRRIGL